MLTENEILSKVKSQIGIYSPVLISIGSTAAGFSGGAPVMVTLALQKRRVKFYARIKTRTAPRIIEEAIWSLKKKSGSTERNLLLIVPYLSPGVVELLNREKVSGLDLNGNFLVQAPGLAAVRLDQKNGFPESQPIRNIFAGGSSLVGRLFLAAGGKYGSVSEVVAAIKRLGGGLSQSAVSKVLKGLEDDLIIEKSPAGIALLQPEKLLRKLGENYRPPKVLGSVKLKLPVAGDQTGMDALRNAGNVFAGPDWIISGESSARRYAAMADSAAPKIYVRDLAPLLKFREDRFYNIEAVQTEAVFPYFDARSGNGLRWASPVQCWLELSRLDKREREIADGVRDGILGGKL